LYSMNIMLRSVKGFLDEMERILSNIFAESYKQDARSTGNTCSK